MIPIILNPASGRGLHDHRLALIRDAAKTLGKEVEIRVLEPDDDIATVVNSYLKSGHRHIILGGGDGTIAASLASLVHHRATLGILPIGTGNLLAMNLHLPRSLPEALAVALDGEARPIDLGRVNGRYFAIIAGLGWDGATMRDAHPRLKRRYGLVVYLWAAIKNIGHPRDIYSIRIDGKPAGNFIANTVMFANMGLIAPRVRLVPGAEPDDGLLDVAVFQTETLTSWLRLVWKGLFGKLHDDPGTVFLRGKKVEVYTTSGGRLLQLDGDFYSHSEKARASVVPGAISVMFPKR